MNEYACYGKGHTIHSSGQIEWFKNSVDDRSVQVGGKQRICTIDVYAMPLTCRGGLLYLSILGKPTDTDLEIYPAVHLTGLVEFWGIPPLVPLLQYVNRLGFEICSVNSCQSEQGSWLQ